MRTDTDDLFRQGGAGGTQGQAVLDAYRRSGLAVDDIDVFETHDCFTSSEYAAISAFGLTEARQGI